MEQFRVSCHRIAKQSKYKVYFNYHEEVINKIRSLPKEEKSWDSTEKCWIMHTRAIYGLMKLYKGSDLIHFDFGGAEGKLTFLEQIRKIDSDEKEKKKIAKALSIKKDTWIKLKDQFETDYRKYYDVTHKNLKSDAKLYPHQIVAAMFLNETKSALLSLEMGLGKTLASIAYVEMNEYKKVFVITPNSLKFNFYNEVKKFTDAKAHIVNWKKNEFSIEESRYIIVNYEFLNPSKKEKVFEKLKKLNIGKLDCLICDESQRLKNTTSNTYKNFKKLFIPKSFRNEKMSKVFLSGTPAPNRAHELYSVLNQISPIDFATKKHFNEYYCGMTYDTFNGYGWSTDAAKQKLEELFHKAAPYTYRKRKKEVLTDLPDKIYQKIALEMTKKEYDMYCEIEEGVANEIFDNPTSNPLTVMLRLRQFTSALKMTRIQEIIDGVLDSDQKIVIVDVFKPTLYELKKAYPAISALHTGDQTVEERAEIVVKFQDIDSDLKMFLGSIQTCNYGLTLTASSNLFIITLPFSVGEYDQVSDRLHRIGQKDTVSIYVILFKESIDEYVYDSIEGKRKEITKVIDNEDYESDIKESVLSDVISRIKQKYLK